LPRVRFQVLCARDARGCVRDVLTRACDVRGDRLLSY